MKMADIKFTGNKKLKSINSEWCNKFPYLYLRFFNEDGKSQGSWDVNHSTVRGKKDASVNNSRPPKRVIFITHLKVMVFFTN